MRVRANAKLNITLNVIGKRSDGYHILDSVMQSITLCDVIDVEAGDKISVICDADDIADVAVVIFYAHVDNAAVIGRTVKGGVYLYAPLAELLADVVGEDDVRSVHISVLPDNGVELIVLHFSRFITLLFHLLN